MSDITINGQPVEGAAQEALENLRKSGQHDEVFQDRDVGNVQEANRLLNPNGDMIANEDDLEQINSKSQVLTEAQFVSLAREFEHRFPEKPEKFAGLGTLLGMKYPPNASTAVSDRGKPKSVQETTVPLSDFKAKKTDPQTIVKVFGKPGKPIPNPKAAWAMIQQRCGRYISGDVRSLEVKKEGKSVEYTAMRGNGGKAALKIIPRNNDSFYQVTFMPDGKPNDNQLVRSIDVLDPNHMFFMLLHMRAGQ